MSYPQQQQYQPAYQAAPPYGYNAQPPEDEEGLGSWVLTLFISGLPLIGFIYLLVLAFGGGDSKAKKNYARATLLIGAIFMAIMIVALILIVTTAGLASIPILHELSLSSS